MTSQDDAARAASDAIDAWCAANPAPGWPFTLPAEAGLRFGPVSERVEVTYTPYYGTPEEAFFNALDDERKQAIYEAARDAALLGRGSVEDVFRALVSLMARYRPEEPRESS